MTLQDELRATRDGTIPPTPRRRWDLLAAWAVILGPALGIAIWVGLRQRVGDLEERLVRDANATFSRPLLRPVHVDAPTPGTFGDAVARHLPPIQRWADSVKEDSKARETARDVVAGRRPISELAPAYATALGTLGPHLDGLLEGTHAEHADLPLAKEAWRPCDGADWSGHQAAVLLAGLRIRRELLAGDAAKAVATCLDGLALGREPAITSGMIGHMTGVVTVKRLLPPCAEAIERLDPERRTDTLHRLRTIRDAFPGVAEMLRVEFLSTELLGQGSVLSASANRRLVPRALAYANEGERLKWWERIVARDAWRGLRETMDSMLRVARSASGDELQEGMRSISMGSLNRVNPVVAIAMPNYAKYARRAEAAVARLDFAVLSAAAAAFREREGRWPASIGELSGRELLTPDEAARLAGAGLVSSGGPFRPLELKLSVYTGDERQPAEELTLSVRPPARAAAAR